MVTCLFANNSLFVCLQQFIYLLTKVVFQLTVVRLFADNSLFLSL